MLKITSITPGAASMSFDLKAQGVGHVATVWSGRKPSEHMARQYADDIKKALDCHSPMVDLLGDIALELENEIQSDPEAIILKGLLKRIRAQLKKAGT